MRIKPSERDRTPAHPLSKNVYSKNVCFIAKQRTLTMKKRENFPITFSIKIPPSGISLCISKNWALGIFAVLIRYIIVTTENGKTTIYFMRCD